MGRCLVTVFVFSLLALAFIGQMPVVAAHNLGIDPKSANYGLLYACFGTGALLGAISIGTVFARTSKAMIVRVCLVCYAVALTAFALLRSALPAYFVVAVVGAFYFAFITALNTALQTRLSDAVRGRVMALWIMGFGGTVALGNLHHRAGGVLGRHHRGLALRRRRRPRPGLVRRRPGPGRRDRRGARPVTTVSRHDRRQATDSSSTRTGSSGPAPRLRSSPPHQLPRRSPPGGARPGRARRRPRPRRPGAPH